MHTFNNELANSKKEKSGSRYKSFLILISTLDDFSKLDFKI